MPFTFSHPAIVLPLEKFSGKWLSMTGLIIGSITPDFEYFIRMKIQSDYSHTIFGALWFNLPLGIFLCFVFHEIVIKELIENLPKSFQMRLHKLKEHNWNIYFQKNWMIVCLSILIGAYSHILWDAFTHPNTFFVNQLGLNYCISDYNIPLYKILQHASTLIGGMYIIWFFLKMEKLDTRVSSPQKSYWLVIAILTILILLIRIVFGLSLFQYGNIIVSVISAIIISTIMISLIEKRKSKYPFCEVFRFWSWLVF